MHCGACHTPKNMAGADKMTSGCAAMRFRVGSRLTSRATKHGIGAWSTDALISYMKTI